MKILLIASVLFAVSCTQTPTGSSYSPTERVDERESIGNIHCENDRARPSGLHFYRLSICYENRDH